MSFMQLLRILWARKLLFVSICVLTVAAAVTASALLPARYVAEAAVVVDVNGTDPLSEKTATPLQLQPAYLATQMDVIASHNVALKVVDRLKLLEDADLRLAFADATQGKGAQRDSLADRLLDNLSVRSSNNGNVIYVQYTGTDARRAVEIADAFADSYIQTTLDLKVDPARRQSGWFAEQVNDLRAKLEAAQQKLSEYQSGNGVIGSDDARLDVENARLEEISNQLVTAQSAMYESTARAQQMSEAASLDRAGELSDVLKSPLLQNLKTELARAEGKFADVSQRFDRNHPQYQSVAAEVAALQKKVTAEIDNARGTVAREASIARQRVANLQQSLEQQRARILSLQHTQNEYAVLKRDVDNARTAYDAALKRSGETQLESRLDQTNIAILNYAVLPMQPASPRPLLNLILALLLGPLLAAAICTSVEMLSRRVHSPDDLLGSGLGPLLAEIPRRGMGRHGRARTVRASSRLQTEPVL